MKFRIPVLLTFMLLIGTVAGAVWFDCGAYGQAPVLPLDQIAQLWERSLEEDRELVACLASDSILPLYEPDANSYSVPRAQSIEVCAPPRWMGTIHTHIPGCQRALNGQCYGWSTFARPSPSDKRVAHEWYLRHRVKGCFCIVHMKGDGFGVKCWRS